MIWPIRNAARSGDESDYHDSVGVASGDRSTACASCQMLACTGTNMKLLIPNTRRIRSTACHVLPSAWSRRAQSRVVATVRRPISCILIYTHRIPVHRDACGCVNMHIHHNRMASEHFRANLAGSGAKVPWKAKCAPVRAVPAPIVIRPRIALAPASLDSFRPGVGLGAKDKRCPLLARNGFYY